MKKRWRRGETEFLETHYPNTDPRKISEKLNRSISSIYSKALRLRLKRKDRIGKKINTTLNESMAYILGVIHGDGSSCVTVEKNGRKEVLELRKRGKTYKEISKLTGMSIETFSKWIRGEHKPFLIFVEDYKKKFLDNSDLIKVWKEGLSQREMSERLGVSRVTISKRMKELNLEPNRPMTDKTVIKLEDLEKSIGWYLET